MSIISYERLMFRQRQALQAWRAAVARDPNSPDVLEEDLVWQLLSLCCERASTVAVPLTNAEDDIAKAAYDLAQRSLERMDFRDFLRIYRDLLVDAEMECVESDRESVSIFSRFISHITDAYWQAYSDSLRFPASFSGNRIKKIERNRLHLQIKNAIFAERTLCANKIIWCLQ